MSSKVVEEAGKFRRTEVWRLDSPVLGANTLFIRGFELLGAADVDVWKAPGTARLTAGRACAVVSDPLEAAVVPVSFLVGCGRRRSTGADLAGSRRGGFGFPRLALLMMFEDVADFVGRPKDGAIGTVKAFVRFVALWTGRQ